MQTTGGQEYQKANFEAIRDLSRERTELAKAQQKLVVGPSAESPCLISLAVLWASTKIFLLLYDLSISEILYECFFHYQFCGYGELRMSINLVVM